MHITYKIIILLNAIVFTVQDTDILLEVDPKFHELQSSSAAKVMVREVLGKVIPDAVGAALLQAFESPTDKDQLELQDFTEYSSDMVLKTTGKTIGSLQVTVERKDRNENEISTDKDWFEMNEECPADE